ncbi:uncharacterized protein LOC133420270 isoform X2 [Cololabis saira]|uniref:uncharacterized protein LOC133420270 isoform X2 n=1 Tax=Cololabis saira TaxID=129043 RepID=UPI002AD3AC74|nr:uncharacterized protein LOC133420270 isoform X2 [Cololabis saira]
MEQKKPKRILKDSLDNLSEQNFQEFCAALVDPSMETRVPLAKVQGKSRLDIANEMISTFTEQGALKVAEKILRYIKCTEAANKLAQEAGAGPGGPANQKTPKKILKDSLDELSEENFNEFCDALVGARVPLVKVQGKSRLEIAEMMISTFMEQGALEGAEKILREISCPLVADKLDTWARRTTRRHTCQESVNLPPTAALTTESSV